MARLSQCLAVDSESDPKVDLFLGISVGFAATGIYFPFNHMEEDANIDDDVCDLLFETLRTVPLRVFHNAAFDLSQFAKHLNLDLWPLPFADTMIMAHMVNENVMSKKLDYLCKYYLGNEGKNRSALMQSIIDNLGWRYVPTVILADYAANDAKITWELYQYLLPLFEEQYGPLYDSRL